MKKIFLFVLTLSCLFILSACGSSELDDFATDFNQSARKYDTVEIKDDEFGELKEDGKDGRKNLYTSKEYDVDAIYENKNLIGYNVNVKSDTDTISKDSKGYNAILTLADVFKLDINKLESNIIKSFDETFIEYEDNKYEVFVSVIDISSLSISVSVYKK